METCFLCLEIMNKEFAENIQVSSVLWQEQNVKQIIEKHIWAMETILPSSWMCKICWKELFDFHKFYMRIEEAHSNLGTLMQSEFYQANQKSYFDKNKHKNRMENKNVFCKKSLVGRHMEPEILMELPISTEFLVEDRENFIQQKQKEDLCSYYMHLERKRRLKDLKSGIKYSREDPLKCTNNYKKSKISCKTAKKTNEIKLTTSTNLLSLSIIETFEQSLITDDTEACNTSKEANDHSDTDFDYQDNKKPRETTYKKRKNPDEQTRLEHDKIILENFQIFCSLCQMPMENFTALRKHFRVQHKKRGFVTCCKRKIFSRPVLVDHIHFHLDPNYFKCNQCGKVLSERSTLESHMKIHVNGEQERKHACDLCYKSFKENTTLENHKLKHSLDNAKKCSCTECGKFFTTLYNLNYHIQAVHHNKFVKICDMCGKIIRSSNSFKLHMEKHANKHGTPITCEICGLRLVDVIGLRRHKNSQHSVGGKNEYACHICSKVFPNLKALRTHIRFVHEIGYDHKCTICDKAFKRRAVLKDHMGTHTGTALNICPWCPKTFFSNGNMYNHRKKDHPREWEELQRQKYATNATT